MIASSGRFRKFEMVQCKTLYTCLLNKNNYFEFQVTIYKDDFDNERRDRERVMHEKSEMGKQFESLTMELVTTQKQVC